VHSFSLSLLRHLPAKVRISERITKYIELFSIHNYERSKINLERSKKILEASKKDLEAFKNVFGRSKIDFSAFYLQIWHFFRKFASLLQTNHNIIT